MRTDTLPGAFRVLSGVEVEEFDALPHGREVKFLGAFGEGTATTWCDVLKCNDATPLAAYGSGYYQGSPAVTVNVYGNGKVYYVGCGLEDDEMDALVALIADSAGITPVLREKIHGVEAVQKEKNGKRYWMLLNHLGHDVSFALEGTYTDLLTGSMASGSVTLSPFGVMVLADASTR